MDTYICLYEWHFFQHPLAMGEPFSLDRKQKSNIFSAGVHTRLSALFMLAFKQVGCENKPSGQPERINSFRKRHSNGRRLIVIKLLLTKKKKKKQKKKSFTVLRSYFTSSEVFKHLRVWSQTPPWSEQLCHTEETFSTSNISWRRNIYVHVSSHIHVCTYACSLEIQCSL